MSPALTLLAGALSALLALAARAQAGRPPYRRSARCK